MLGAWKGVPYAKRLCWGYNLGKVEDEVHLLLVCPNTQKVREHFCLALPFTHINTLVEFMQITNMVTVIKFVAWCQYHRTSYLVWYTFRLMDFLIPHRHKIVNSKQLKRIIIIISKLFIITFVIIDLIFKKNSRYCNKWWDIRMECRFFFYDSYHC
jgi:hypothetical protein